MGFSCLSLELALNAVAEQLGVGEPHGRFDGKSQGGLVLEPVRGVLMGYKDQRTGHPSPKNITRKEKNKAGGYRERQREGRCQRLFPCTHRPSTPQTRLRRTHERSMGAGWSKEVPHHGAQSPGVKPFQTISKVTCGHDSC